MDKKIDKEIELLKDIERQLKEISPAKYLAEIVRLETNINRFQDHLNTIATVLGIEWIDGEYPLEKVLEKIKNI